MIAGKPTEDSPIISQGIGDSPGLTALEMTTKLNNNGWICFHKQS